MFDDFMALMPRPQYTKAGDDGVYHVRSHKLQASVAEAGGLRWRPATGRDRVVTTATSKQRCIDA